MEKDYRLRFSGKADLYAAGRPSYAEGFFQALADIYDLKPGAVAADIGSGTGKLTRQLLERGYRVYGVEPNADMRRLAEADLASFPTFYSSDGDAAASGLPDHCADFITAAQAFHWFPIEPFHRECCRIGRGMCPIFLLWNQRDMTSAVTQDLHRLYTQYGKDFHGFNMGLKQDDERIRAFFASGYNREEYPNPLYYNKESFRIRCLSSSHSPRPGDETYDGYLEEIDAIFNRYARDGQLEVPNRTTVYAGRFAS